MGRFSQVTKSVCPMSTCVALRTSRRSACSICLQTCFECLSVSLYVYVCLASMCLSNMRKWSYAPRRINAHHKTHQTFGQRAVMMIVVMWPYRWPPATINYQTPSIYLSETNPRHRAPVRSNTLWHHVRLLLPLKYNFYSTRKYRCGQMYSWARKNVTVCF